MELTLFNQLLSDPVYGWVGWVLLLTIALTVALGIITKWLIVLVNNVRELRKPKPTKDVKRYFELRGQIRQACRDIKHNLRADRVSIYELQNGEASLGNVPFMKLVITEESCSTFAESVLVHTDKIQSAIFGELNDEMVIGKMHITWNLSDTEELVNKDHNLSVLRQFLQAHGTKSFFMFPMLKPDGVPLGFGLVEFTQHVATCEDDLISQARTKFGAIGGILTVLSTLEKPEVIK